MSYYYDCWKCAEWHPVKITNRRELKAVQEFATVKRLKPHRRKFRTGRNSGGRLFLVPLPFALGLVFGIGNRLFLVRAWDSARYDYADHDPENSPRWNRQVLSRTPNAPAGIVARWVEGYWV